jgi:hypothetical protein
VSPALSYSEYVYKSSVTRGLSEQFIEYAQFLSEVLVEKEWPVLLDVGSNDGTFLQACRTKGISSYGIEPALHLAKSCSDEGLPTAVGYFGANILELLLSNAFPTKYDCVTFNNVLANIPDPLTALKKATYLLKDSDSFICIQTGYHPLQFKKGLFDWVYHEHFSYFSLKSLATLASRAGLYISDYSINSIRGGSLRVVLSPEKNDFNAPYEYYTSSDHFRGLRCYINESSKLLGEQLLFLNNRKCPIYGFGASHSTGILLKVFGVEQYLDCLYDDNPDKNKCYMPATSLLVCSTSKLHELPAKSAIVILAWQYFDAISNRITTAGYPGLIINPVLL